MATKAELEDRLDAQAGTIDMLDDALQRMNVEALRLQSENRALRGTIAQVGNELHLTCEELAHTVRALAEEKANQSRPVVMPECAECGCTTDELYCTGCTCSD